MPHPYRLPLLALMFTMLPGIRIFRASAALQFEEVYRLVSTNLTALPAGELNELAVAGLLEQLGPRARFVDDAAPAPVGELIVATRVFPDNLGYVRLGDVSGGVAPRLAAALETLAATNALQGLVLDLRFAGGADFATAARTADLFFAPGEPVLDWGEDVFRATSKTNRFTRPVAVLVNGSTSGSAEALAAALRSGGLALLIGSPTAGEAAVYRDFPLTDGRKLRVAVTPVKTGDGQPVQGTGLKPDIAQVLPPEMERQYLANPYLTFSGGGSATRSGDTNEVTLAGRGRPRLNEAELIRARQEALNPAGAPTEPAKIPSLLATSTAPLVRDPVLARGLDLLKGLNAVQPPQ